MTTPAALKARRTKWATDIFYRVWDEFHSRWIVKTGRTIWPQKKVAERIRDKLIEGGRNPDHLSVERVHVEVR